MRKLILIAIVLFFLLILSVKTVSADIDSDLRANMVSHWDFQNDLQDSYSSNHWTDQGVAYTNCVIGVCAEFDGGGFANQSGKPWAEIQNFSWSFWGRLNNSGSYFISQGRNDAQPYVGNHFRLFQAAVNISWFAGRLGGNGFFYQETFDLPIIDINGSWHLYTISVDTANDNITLYVDDAIGANISTKSTDSNGVRYNVTIENINLMKDIDASTYVEGHLDELIYFNRSLNSSEHNYLWNSGSGRSMAPLDVGLQVTLLNPNATNTTTEMTFFFNTSGGYNLTNCSLYTTDEGWKIDVTNTSLIPLNTTVSLDYNFTAGGLHYWNVECYDLSSDSDFADANFSVSIELEANYTLKRFECDLSTTGMSIGLIGFTFFMVLIWALFLYTKLPFLNILISLPMFYFAWYIAACFFLANLIFILMGFTSLLKGIAFYSDEK